MHKINVTYNKNISVYDTRNTITPSTGIQRKPGKVNLGAIQSNVHYGSGDAFYIIDNDLHIVYT